MSEAALMDKPKKLAPGTVRPIGHDLEYLAVIIPDDWSFADVMKPAAWVYDAPKFAADKFTGQRAKIGSIIIASSSKFVAMLRIQAITLDDQKNPAGLALLCIGPSFDPVSGKAAPVNAHNGMPWNG